MPGRKPPRVDPSGQFATEPDPVACQRLVIQFRRIVSQLWTPFENVDGTRDYTTIFAELCEAMADALGATRFFIAKPISTDEAAKEHTEFRIVGDSWVRGGKKGARQAQVPRRLRQPFKSIVLSEAMVAPTRVVFYPSKPFHAKERPPLSQLIDNLGVVRIWFGPGKDLVIGLSVPEKDKYKEAWTGSEERLLSGFPEILATPLRIENERQQNNWFHDISCTGSSYDVVKLAAGILESRISLAWHARTSKAMKSQSEKQSSQEPSPDEHPKLGGDYDSLFADYLDAKRYLVGKSAGPVLPSVLERSFEDFARMFDPRSDKEIRLFTSPDRGRESAFMRGTKAALSHHALARTLLWTAYKTGSLPGGEAQRNPCPLAGRIHNGCKGTKAVCLEFVDKVIKTEPTPEPNAKVPEGTAVSQESEPTTDCNPPDPYPSWLRCLWLEIYYRARQMIEHRGEVTDPGLKYIADRYTEAAQKTGVFFRKFLDSVQKAEHADNVRSPRIDWRWLYLWFLGEALTSTKLTKHYGEYKKKAAGQETHIAYYLNASIATLSALNLAHFWDSSTTPELWDLPEVHSHELGRARIHLLCEYAYLEIGVERAWQLEHHLSSQFKPEIVLYTASSSHRDHLLHVVDVCLLGHLLLTAEQAGGSRFSLVAALFGKGFATNLRQPQDPLGKNTPDNLRSTLRAWYPAALLHDIGYTLALSKILPDLLAKLSTPDLAAYVKHVRSEVKCANETLDRCIAEQLDRVKLSWTPPPSRISSDHGAVTVDHLIHSLEKAKGDPAFLSEPLTHATLQAILRHDRKKEKFNAEDDPLSFLLLLCDHLHEWGRPRVRPDRFARAFLTSFHMSAPFVPDVENSAEYLLPNATYDPKADTLIFRKEQPPTFNLVYCAARSRLLEPACNWVDVSADFERISFPEDFPKMGIRFVHPKSELIRRSSLDTSEMQLLRDYAATANGTFLWDWLNAVTDDAVSHMKHGISGEERDQEEKKDAKTENEEQKPTETRKEPEEKDNKEQKRTEGEQEEYFEITVGVSGRAVRPILPSVPDDFYSNFVEWKERKLRLLPDDD